MKYRLRMYRAALKKNSELIFLKKLIGPFSPAYLRASRNITADCHLRRLYYPTHKDLILHPKTPKLKNFSKL